MARWPVDGPPRVASPYGDPRRIPGAPGYPAHGRGPHWGHDIAGHVGDAIRAPEAMRILDVQSSSTRDTRMPAPWDGYGPGIVLARGVSGSYHLLAHLSGTAVVKGQTVDEGAYVGAMGDPGGGAHVHWEVRTVPVDKPETRGSTTDDPTEWLHANGGGAPSDPPPRSSSSTAIAVILLGLLYVVTRRR